MAAVILREESDNGHRLEALNRVAESDIDAHLYSGAANPGPEAGANPGILSMLMEWFHAHRLGIEHDSIIDNRHRANGTNGTTDAPLPRVAAPGKVEIAGWAVGRLTPQSEKHRPLQNKPAAMLGLAKAVQESLGRVSLQQELKVLILFAAPVQQSGADRCGNVSEWPARHEISACRYAVMTDRARQASAARMISSTVATRRFNASRRASRAMSRPSLLR